AGADRRHRARHLWNAVFRVRRPAADSGERDDLPPIEASLGTELPGRIEGARILRAGTPSMYLWQSNRFRAVLVAFPREESMNAAMMLFVLAASPAPQSWKFKTGATPTVTVSNVDGSISVQAVPGEEVSVEATIVGGEDDGWKVDVKQEGAEVHARACCGACDSQQGNKCGSREVDFVLRVPPGTRLQATPHSPPPPPHRPPRPPPLPPST